MIALTVVSALYLLVVGPVLVACLFAIRREEPDSLERAVADVQDFIDLREPGAPLITSSVRPTSPFRRP